MNDTRRILLTTIWLFSWGLPALSIAALVPNRLVVIWAVSGILFGLFLISARHGKLVGVILLLLAISYLSLSLAGAVSIFMQGTLPDLRFFAHLDGSTFGAALQAYFWPTVATTCFLFGLLASVMTLHIWQPVRPPLSRIIGPLSLILAAVLFVPGHSTLFYLQSHYTYNALLQAKLNSSIQRPRISGLPAGKTPKNIILIYAESLEQTYLREDLFGDIMPQLRTLRSNGINFTNIHQYPGTSWTAAGIVSSQCGIPLISRNSGNQILASVENPFQNITCLAEFLKSQGYATTYMGGASLDFAGKGNFLSANGYEAVFGYDELKKFAQRSPWGLYDAQLFEEVGRVRNQLAKSATPYFLTLLTLDTHHPYGHPSPECASEFSVGKDILTAVSCSDKLISRFIRETLQGPEGKETIIAVLSDHLAMRNTASSILEAADRRLLFSIFNTNSTPQEITAQGTHFDITPTLLDAAGFGPLEFGFGQSLLSHSQGGVLAKGLTQSDLAALELGEIFPTITLPQTVTANAKRLFVGDTSFMVRDGNVKIGRRRSDIGDGRFLAVGLNSRSAALPRIIGRLNLFLEALEKNKADDLWLVYNDGHLDCQVIPDCAGSPRLILLNNDGGSKHVVTGEGTLEISRSEFKAFLANLPKTVSDIRD
ncbi:sulfatase-like hydrolase/transferase [Sulfitobacter aestuariivivens]|uniref:Sulfatase-like hydrolase/transferase n=1 Tax=Sulfitobacter aestuariivivens TaxID=2766981 RepID=A0A927D946_9RHOB|nr:sulfatase-like hydrolase/transferase [Sulfitobacter aestuariivivens]MBD3665472.1 sulfatase-like hydrolase/transferase [Sulfitobacter aestuariivivens]